jgi:hypothetical protein
MDWAGVEPHTTSASFATLSSKITATEREKQLIPLVHLEMLKVVIYGKQKKKSS